MSKQLKVINYIKDLKEGERISVRGLSDTVKVSEGTAYKAIKDAEKMGLVATIPRVGTVRINKIDKKSMLNLTCREVANIVDGTVLGGKMGLNKQINNFVIGAMTVDAMGKYLAQNDILIVGNREQAHKLALENECAVLITGGFRCSDTIRKLADQKKLPIISCKYDTFTTATLINNAMGERKIKSNVILCEDIMKTNFILLDSTSKISDIIATNKITMEDKFYVVDEKNKLIGYIIYDSEKMSDPEENILKYVEKDFVHVNYDTTVSYAGHLIIKNELDRVPVLEGKRMIGILLKEDVENVLIKMNTKNAKSHTIEEIFTKKFHRERYDKGVIYRGKILPEMINQVGIASWSVLNFMMSTTGTAALKAHKIYNIIVDSFNVVFIKPLQMDTNIEIKGEIIDLGKNSSKVEVTLRAENKELVGRAYLVIKMLGK